MNLWQVFASGCLGAIAPEIVRLYALRTRPSRFEWSGFYVGISVLFAMLGGVLAMALPATTYWGAIYAGISTPMVVNTVLKKSLKESEKRNFVPQFSPASLRTFVAGL